MLDSFPMGKGFFGMRSYKNESAIFFRDRNKQAT